MLVALARQGPNKRKYGGTITNKAVLLQTNQSTHLQLLASVCRFANQKLQEKKKTVSFLSMPRTQGGASVRVLKLCTRAQTLAASFPRRLPGRTGETRGPNTAEQRRSSGRGGRREGAACAPKERLARPAGQAVNGAGGPVWISEKGGGDQKGGMPARSEAADAGIPTRAVAASIGARHWLTRSPEPNAGNAVRRVHGGELTLWTDAPYVHNIN